MIQKSFLTIVGLGIANGVALSLLGGFGVFVSGVLIGLAFALGRHNAK